MLPRPLQSASLNTAQKILLLAFVKKKNQVTKSHKFPVLAQGQILVMVKGRAKAQNSAALAILTLPAPAMLFSALLQKASIKIAASFLHQLQPGQSLTALRRGAPRTYKIMRTLSMCRLILITPAWAGIALAPQMKILI